MVPDRIRLPHTPDEVKRGLSQYNCAMSTTLTIDIPDELAARVKSAAGSRPLAEVILDCIARGVEESPVERMSDDEVHRVATAMWPPSLQIELSDLLADQRESRLTADGRKRLDELMTAYRSGLLVKARAVNEAARRGLK